MLFTSTRATASPSPTARFWTVPVAGGPEVPLALPRGYQGKIAPDGRRIAYRMNSSWDEERRNYKGGQNKAIWIADLTTHEVVTPPWTGSKEMDPVWLGDTVYFLSDRDGVSNVWSFAPAGQQLAQVTRFTDFDVKTLGAGGGVLVFEQGGHVHLLDPKAGKPSVVPIRVAGDFPWMMPHWEDVTAPDDQPGHVAHRPPRAGRKRAARSSRFPPTRATSAISRRRAAPPSASRRGRPTASTCRISATPAASTGWSSKRRTA